MGKFPINHIKMLDLKDNKTAVKILQYAKNYLEDVADKANESPSVIVLHLQMIDAVQKYLDPSVDFNKLQDEINAEKK